MSSFNRGEWSEMYAILSLLLCPDLSIGNSELEEITNELFTLKRIQIVNPNEYDGIVEYCLNNQLDVEVYYNSEFEELISQFELSNYKYLMLDAIQHAPTGDGTFEIRGIDDLLIKMNRGEKIKSRSFSKEDLQTIVRDNRIGEDAELKYSIKSSLGSPATLLNASSCTNFLFSVSGISDSLIETVNSIQTHNKLLDRIHLILSSGGIIKFERVIDPDFNYNLQMIDSRMPEYLANVLLDSYICGTKDLKQLFIQSNQFVDTNYALRKLGDLLEGISFGFFPGIRWDGENQVNGGLVIVKNNGNIMILDLIYYKREVIRYLINETKLDSPSSTRYNMLHLYRDPNEDKIFFTLNLQIRYKR